ncbi:hypothetical protein [Jeotgalibacillus malaysiensis]|uniref:hypothetical protein n=1 Tax=Jeotgalibacillus malaysiensis TaxID=1508404 RepID=UPI00384F8879
MPEVILFSAAAIFLYHVVLMLKRRIILAERFVNTVVSVTAGGAGLTASLSFFLVFEGAVLWVFALFAPAGYFYGALSGYASAGVSGAVHMSIGSAMGLMLGEVMQNPALCGLPIMEWQMMLPICSMIYFLTVSVLIFFSFEY